MFVVSASAVVRLDFSFSLEIGVVRCYRNHRDTDGPVSRHGVRYGVKFEADLNVKACVRGEERDPEYLISC